MTKAIDEDKSTAKPIEGCCNFCGLTTSETGPLVTSGVSEIAVTICESCVVAARGALRKENAKRMSLPQKLREAPTPASIKAHLDARVVGQESAKRKLAVAAANHYLRIIDSTLSQTPEGSESDSGGLHEVTIEKSNVLLWGPTGTGKTLLARSLAEVLDVPFAIGDATTLTEAGYVGDDVENLLLKLLAAADFDLERAEQGIIFIDEFDKLRRTTGNLSIRRDVGGEGVQQALLKLIEGSTCRIPPQGGRKHPEQQCIEMDTTNILFICGGAFSDLEAIVRRRLGQGSFGFQCGAEPAECGADWSSSVLPEDLEAFGLIPELVGRLPVFASLHDLKIESLCEVLTAPKNALLKQFQKLVQLRGGSLEFTTGAVREIARQAYAKGSGARGLRAVVEAVMCDWLFEYTENATSSRYVVTKSVVERSFTKTGLELGQKRRKKLVAEASC